MSQSRVVRVAAVQAHAAFLKLEETVARLEFWTAKAAGEGAQLVAFPETWLPGYPAWLDDAPGAALWEHAGARAVFQRLFENSVEVPGPVATRIGAAAREHSVALIVGVHERAGRTLYNTLLTFAPDGTLANQHRKLVPTYHERLIWGQGDGRGLVAPVVAGVRVGGLICWEHWMPLARQVMHDAGEDIHVAAWPAVQDLHQVASRHYAFEGRCFVIAAGQLLRARDMPPELPLRAEKVSDADALLCRGGSAVIAPSGTYLAGPVYDEETLVLADCDLGEIVRESLTFDVSGHYARPDLFDLRFRAQRPEAV